MRQRVAGPWERHLRLFPTLEPSNLTVVVAQPDKRHANRTASVLECMTDTEHSKTFGLNEEEEWWNGPHSRL